MTKIYVKSDDLRTAAGRYDQAVAQLDHALGTYPALLADLPPDLRARAEHVERRARADVGQQRTFAAAESEDLKTRGLLADLLELGVLSKVFGKMANVMPGMGRGPGLAKHFAKQHPHPKKPHPKDDKPKADHPKDRGPIATVGKPESPPPHGEVVGKPVWDPVKPGAGDRTPHDPPARPGENPWKAEDLAYAMPLIFTRPQAGGRRSPKPHHLRPDEHKAKSKPHPHRAPAPSTFGDEFTP